jgi:hypothetical protein
MRGIFLVGAALAGLVAFAPIVSAQPMEPVKKMSMKMSNGKTLDVELVRMNGRMMALVPVDQLEEVLSRAEGHSMNLGGG